MIPPRRHQQNEANVDSWLMTYADMITLLLCFFIIFVAISKPLEEEFTKITEGMTKKFGGTVDLSTPFQGIVRSLQAVVETHQVLKDVSVEKTETGIEMEISSEAFFKPNSAELDKDKLPMLLDMAGVIRS
ncbi:MAG: hypothetical protein KGJ06_04770, partial [Pseudomonadota bacterium]|nr:hypothetical protein [Pseudomonadota bacterium]